MRVFFPSRNLTLQCIAIGKWSDISLYMIAEVVRESNLLKNILSSNVAEVSVMRVGLRISGYSE